MLCFEVILHNGCSKFTKKNIPFSSMQCTYFDHNQTYPWFGHLGLPTSAVSRWSPWVVQATLVILGWQPWSSWVGIAGRSGRATMVVPGVHLSHALRPPDPFQVSLAQLSNNPKIISRTAAPNSIMLQKLGQCRSLGYSQLFQLSHNRCSPISRTSASHWQKFSLISVGWYKKQSCVGMRASQYEATLKCRGQ